MKIFKNENNDVRVGWKIVMLLAGSIIGSLIVSLIFTLLIGDVTENAVMTHILFIFQKIVTVCVVVLLWKLLDKKDLKGLGLPKINTYAMELIKGLLFGAGAILLVFFILIMTNQLKLNHTIRDLNFSWLMLWNLASMCFVGFTEELFSRGYLMSILRKSSVLIIFLVPNLLFSILHALNPNITLLSFINISLVGILLSYMFWVRGNLWMPIGFHITWNFFQGSILGFSVSGTDTPSILSTRLLKENLFNGGAFGPEGGFVTTIVVLLCAFVIFLVRNNKNSVGFNFNETYRNTANDKRH